MCMFQSPRSDGGLQLLPGVNLAEEIEKANEAENAPEVPADLGNLPRNDDDSPEARMVSRFQKLHLQPDAHRFYGKSRCVISHPRQSHTILP